MQCIYENQFKFVKSKPQDSERTGGKPFQQRLRHAQNFPSLLPATPQRLHSWLAQT
jgi:hypothetical protein